MKMKLLAVIFIVLVCGCTQQGTKNIKIPGHGDQVYEFSYDISETLQIPVNEPYALKQLMNNNQFYVIVFDGTNEIDNGRFRVSIINMVIKLKLYYLNEKNLTLDAQNFPVFYFVDNETGRYWYNSQDGLIQPPVFREPVIWFKGPNTGANETAVKVNGNIIYVSGTTGQNVERATDRFVLAVFGIQPK